MRATLLIALFPLALAACKQDPLRLRNYRDGAVLDVAPPNGDGPRGERGLVDGLKGEAKPPDRGPISWDACRATLEACNGVDDNCNGEADEGFDKINDPRYCENCAGCAKLSSPTLHVVLPACKAGKCSIGSCASGYYDIDADLANGCEYNCMPTGVEVCDGEDNDCNGTIDDNVPPLTVNVCKQQGACAGAKAACKGKLGWLCDYDPTKVELQACATDKDCGTDAQGNAINKCDTATSTCPGVVTIVEKKCDGVDGDCSGLIDDPWSTQLGKECELDNPPLKGACRNVGKFACDAATNDVKCQLVTAGVPASVEVCDNKDNDCDGVVDNLDPTKNPTAELWVSVGGGVKIFKFEASRPDATATGTGIVSDRRPCSVPGRLPWANITRDEAQAACVRAGGHLCTTVDWEKACKGQAGTTFPYGNTFQPQTCNGHAYDPAIDGPLPTDKPGGQCVSSLGGETIFNMSGNVKEWTVTSFDGTGKPVSFELKGGAYDTPSVDTFGAGLSCTYQLPAPTTNLQLPTIGFRCCK